MNSIPELSIVIPVFNEGGNLNVLTDKILDVLAMLGIDDYEIIFVDDGSHDNSWEIIEQQSAGNSRIKGISFSRNFGHQYALKAGIDTSRGQAVIMLDADLQHPPAMISDFYREWKNGFEIVYGYKKDTEGISKRKSMSSGLFYGILNRITDIKLKKGASDFRLLDRKVVDEIKHLNEYYLFLRGLVNWLGFQSKGIEYIAPERFSGSSKYTLKRMLRLASDGIMSFSIRPLRIAMYMGFILSLFAFAYIVYALVIKFYYHNALEGWTSLLISVLLIGGIQLLSLGIIGEYIGKIFMESKRRPHYIISKRTG